MKTIATTLAALALSAGLAAAQTAAPAAPVAAPAAPAATPAAPAPAPAPSDLTKDGKVRMKVVRAQCRDEVKATGARCDARKEAMAACVVKARPDKAAQVKCAMDPQAKGMDKTARHAFVKDCVAKAKG